LFIGASGKHESRSSGIGASTLGEIFFVKAMIEFSQASGISYFDPFEYLKSPIHDGTLLYTNADHLYAEGGKLLEPAIKQFLDKR